MIIEGDARYVPENDFRPKIQQALDLLQSKGSPDYMLINTYVERICAFNRTGAVVTDARINIAKPTFETSITWLASVLVHECFHICQYLAKKKYVGKDAEGEANIIQLYTLQIIGAPQNEITYMRAQDGTHFDLDGDGKYSREDYRRRTY